MYPVTQAQTHLALHRRAVLQHLQAEQRALRGALRAQPLHRRQRQHRHIAGLGVDEEHLGAHLGHQPAVRVVHVELRVVEHHVVDDFRGRQDLAEGGLPAPLLAEGGEVHRHAGREPADVRLGDLGLDGHARQVGDLHDHRRALVGVQGLALLGRLRHHGAAHRRIDLGVFQVGQVFLEARLGLGDLRLQRLDLRGGDLRLGLGALQRLLAGGLRGEQRLLPLVLQVGQAVLRLLLLELGALAGQLRAGGVDLGLEQRGVDLGQQLALLDRVAQLHVQLAQLAGNLGADIHVVARLQGTEGGDAVLDITPADGGGAQVGVGLGVVAQHPEHGQASKQQDDQRQQPETAGAQDGEGRHEGWVPDSEREWFRTAAMVGSRVSGGNREGVKGR